MSFGFPSRVSNLTKLPFALALMMCTLVPDARGEVVSIVADRDNTLYQDALGATSNGAGQYLFSGVTAMESARRALLHFDLAAALPAGSTIISASVQLTMNRGISGAAFMTLHRVSADWGEGPSDALDEEGAGAPALPGDATWLNTFFPPSTSPLANWSNAGGDFDQSPSAILSVLDVGAYSWSSPALASDAQSMLDSPAANFGWLLLGDEFSVPPSAKRFASRENPDPLARPTLTIEYTIPAPSALAALSLVVLPMVRRRARSA